MKVRPGTNDDIFFDRDLSWLSFNERVLDEARRTTVPLMERIKFLAIYSSNLDEFYRVRMPALMALKKLSEKSNTDAPTQLPDQVHERVLHQQQHFGSIIRNQILPALKDCGIRLVYNEPLPEPAVAPLRSYFLYTVSSYIRIIPVSRSTTFFPENSKLYILVTVASKKEKQKQHFIVNIPSDVLPRFYTFTHGQTQYIVFLDDIVKLSLPKLFTGKEVISSQSFKTTRDAELDLRDEFTGDLARKIEKKIRERDAGTATRFLYEPGIPETTLELLRSRLNLKGASFVHGGAYHNLKDLATLPLKAPQFHYEPWPKAVHTFSDESLFTQIRERDILLHPPYHAYDGVIRFFNEAAIDPAVDKICVTLYRVADDSRIVNALISAAQNGKKVVVFVELKARFDEANNIRWSRKMKAAGVVIIESIPGLKVHAKLALVRRRSKKGTALSGLISTGNFNESTARFYTDHILMTAHQPLLREVEKLFLFLKKRKKPSHHKEIIFKHLLVAQFNLQQRFLKLIDREIVHARKGLDASMIIKLNNLEDQVLIGKLYEASRAGVRISLIVRSICCLVPGVKGMSEHITVRRIVDRYLEHSRVFIFHNNNTPEVFLGSADWMNRNIYRRIEVCAPVYDAARKAELIHMIKLQFEDTHQAVTIGEAGNNIPVEAPPQPHCLRCQYAIGTWLSQQPEELSFATNNMVAESTI